jgi:hypothetical protein
VSVNAAACENPPKPIDDDDHENAREQNACYPSRVASFENGDSEKRNSIRLRAHTNIRVGSHSVITHVNFVVARWCCGSDLRVNFAATLTMTRCDHRVDKSLSFVTSITTHELRHCA